MKMKNNIKHFCFAISMIFMQNLFPGIAYAENSNLIDVNFGELLTLQEKNGYEAFNGENMLENFYQAKAELPEEIPVLDSFDVEGENVYFVALTGDDEADGSEASPLATVTEALKRISALSDSEKAGGSVIYIREGEYHLNDVISITDEHTSDDSTLFISSYHGEKVVLRGDENVLLSKAVKVTRENSNLELCGRINNDAVGKLFYITYEDMGIDKIPYESIFYFNNVPMFISRYPNQGTDTVDSVIEDGSYVNGEGLTRTGLPMEWKSQDEHPFTWKDNRNIHIFGRVANEWSLTDGKVWFDDDTNTIKTTSALTPNYSPVTTNFWSSISSTYYYTNIFEEIDSFGEWFADDEAQRFYFYLPEDIDKESSYISYKKHGGYGVEVSDSRNVVFNRIDFSNMDYGIKISNSKAVVLQNLSLRDINNTAVYMTDTEKCGILNSAIRNVSGDYAVIITQSAENISNLVPRRNFIQNSSINNVKSAVNVSGSTGNIFSHNLIENTGFSAIYLTGAENIFEYNEFSGVANQITDAGGIYIGGDIKNRANTIRYNYFHDSNPDKKNARAIYNDDCSDMSWNYGNVIKNFGYGISLHSGDDHVIMDNIVINADTYIRNSADYATQEYLMKNYFFVASPQFIQGYQTYNLGNSQTWQRRYSGILKEKYDKVLEAKAGVDKDANAIYNKIINVVTGKNKASDYTNAQDVQKACDLVVDSGCYYIGNTYVVPGWTYSNGYGPSAYGRNNVCEPDNRGKPKVKYVSASSGGNNYDISGYVKNMGLLNSAESEKSKPVIYMEQKKEFAKDDFTGISWSSAIDCSYYKAEIATDAEFKNIVISYDTPNTEYPVYTYAYDKAAGVNVKNKTNDYDFLTNVPYYVRVTAISLANCIENPDTISDVKEFILRDELNILKDSSVVKSYFGNTSMKIKIAGSVPDYLINEVDKQITIMLVDEGTIKHIGQIDASQNNTFSYVFSEDITDTTRIKIRAGNNDITDEVFSNAVENITEVSFDTDGGKIAIGEVVTAVAKINNMFNVTDVFSIAVTSYDENGRLIDVKMIDSREVEENEIYELSNKYVVPQGAVTVKAFLWTKSNMKPLTDAIIENIE